MTEIRLKAHPGFTANLAGSAVLLHWHRGLSSPECHVVGEFRPEISVAELEAAAAKHLVGHGMLQGDADAQTS